MDTGCIASGLAFNGYNEDCKSIKLTFILEKPLFDRVKTIGLRINITGYDIKTLYANWNMMTSSWLKHYVYIRILRKQTKKSEAMPIIATFAVSAVWHGFYPGYFIFFFASAIADIGYKQG
jgi:lysophospholipid acyltransferase